jgi:hypothetical protein
MWLEPVKLASLKSKKSSNQENLTLTTFTCPLATLTESSKVKNMRKKLNLEWFTLRVQKPRFRVRIKRLVKELSSVPLKRSKMACM